MQNIAVEQRRGARLDEPSSESKSVVNVTTIPDLKEVLRREDGSNGYSGHGNRTSGAPIWLDR
jgi:hypothetical protein